MNTHILPEALSALEPSPVAQAKADINFLYEMGRFRQIPRSWKTKIGLPEGMIANDAEHTFSTTSIALLLAKQSGLNDAEIHYVAFMTWVHDIGEVRTGDGDPNTKPYVTVDEERAMQDAFGKTPLFSMAMAAYTDYKGRKSIVARIVKAADILDSVRELLELREKGVRYIDRIPTRIANKRVCLQELNVPSAVTLFDNLLAAGPEAVWDHFLNDAESTFTQGTYGK